MVVKKTKIGESILEETCLQIEKPSSRSNGIVYVVNAILNALIVVGTIGCFMESLSIEWSPFLIVATAVFCAIWFSFFYKNSWLRFFGYVGVAAIFFLGIIRYYSFCMSGFAIVLNRFLELFGQWFNVSVGNPWKVINSNSAGTSVTVFLIALCLILTLFFNVVISQLKSYWVILIFTTPFVQLPMCCQREVSIAYFMLYLIGVLALFCMRVSGHFSVIEDGEKNYNRFFKKKKIVCDYKVSGRVNLAILSLVLMTVFDSMISLKVICPKEQVIFHKNFKWKQELEDFIGSMTGSQTVAQGKRGVGVGELGNVRFVRQDGLPDLFVYLEKEVEETLYLHAYRSSTYYDNAWLEDSVVTRLETQPGDMFVYLDRKDQNFLGTKKQKMYICNLDAFSRCYYVPYWRDKNLASFEGRGGSSFLLQGKNFTVSEIKEVVKKVRNTKNKLLWEEFFFWEQECRESARETCLEVDDGQKERLLKLCREKGLKEGEEGLVEKVQQFLQEEYRYTLSPGLTPEGKDFVEYFLFEQGEGYCSHFASAAVLLYRSLRIPARYVVGYVVSPDSISESANGATIEWDEQNEVKRVLVSDEKAHAWVEVYVDGFGWYPVEVTSSRRVEETEEKAERMNYCLIAKKLVVIIGAYGVTMLILFLFWKRKQGQEFSCLEVVAKLGGCNIRGGMPLREIASEIADYYNFAKEDFQKIVAIVETQWYSSRQLRKEEKEWCKQQILGFEKEIWKKVSWQKKILFVASLGFLRKIEEN